MQSNLGDGRHLDDTLTRRRFLAIGGCAWGGMTLPPPLSAEPQKRADRSPKPRVFRRYSELLETIEKRGHKPRVLGHAPDRSPIVAVKTGGDKKPPIFITAGSHSTEHAGVAAAVELIDRLDTEHQVYVIPTRDPMGLNGYGYVLGLSLGREPRIASLAELETLLRQEGEVIYDKDERLLVLIGEYGYANRGLYRRFQKGAEFLEPLKGRRIFFPSRSEEMEGAAPFQRAYTLIVTPQGEVLHLNRFHDTPWAPVEVRCTRRLMAEIQPGLSFDLHEYGGDAFWMSGRRQRNDEHELWEQRMAREAVRAVVDSGAKLAADDYLPGSFFTKFQRGVFWLDASRRGEGLNLIDYAAHVYGPGFTIETGMRSPFEQRVRVAMLTVQTAVKVFEKRYA